MIDYFIGLKQGTEEPAICYGFEPHRHKPIERIVSINKYFYSHVCPLCGFGSGGGISEEDYDRYHSSPTRMKGKKQ